MNIQKLNPIIKRGLNFITSNRAEMLAGGSLIGLAATVYFSGKTALAIDRALEGVQITKENWKDPEVVKTIVKAAAPAALSAGFTAACIVGSQVIAHKQYGALMAAYVLGQDKLKAFESKTIELAGKEKTDEIKAEIAQQRVLMAPVTSQSGMVIDTGNGNTLCLDTLSGRYFKSSVEHLRRAQNDVNEQINGDWSATLNEFYAFLNLQSIKLGEDLGWNTENPLRLRFDSALTSSGEPVLVLDYEAYPEYRLL